MSATLDVNVLVYAADETTDRFERARALLDHVTASTSITYLFWPVLVEFVRIITHPSIVTAPLDAAAAITGIDDLISRPQIVLAGEGGQFWNAFKGVVASVVPRGKLVPDAHLVALMHEHGVSTIWTSDRDFRKFDGIKVLDPFDDRWSGGFRSA